MDQHTYVNMSYAERQQYDAQQKAIDDSNALRSEQGNRVRDLAMDLAHQFAEVNRLRSLNAELVKALYEMTEWAAYLDDCDTFYARNTGNEGDDFDGDLQRARELLSRSKDAPRG